MYFCLQLITNLQLIWCNVEIGILITFLSDFVTVGRAEKSV